MKLDRSGHEEVADVYERMLKGDRNAVGELNKISVPPPRKASKPQTHAPSQVTQNQKLSQDLSKASRSQNFRKYLRQKVAEINTGNPPTKKQLIHKQKQADKSQFAEPKPFSKVPKRSQIKSQQKATQSQNSNQPPVLTPSMPPKTKTTSNNFQQNIQKNIIKDSKSVTDKDKHTTPPSSKQSFRIRAHPGNSKKLLQQLMRINDEQKRIQTEIFHYHKDHKDYIAEICEKYNIAQLSDSYVKIKQSNIDQSLDNIQSPNIKQSLKMVQSSKISQQQQKIKKLNKQIAALNTELAIKKTQITKKEAKIELLPLMAYLNSVPDDIFEQRESEEQNQQVGQLPSPQKNMTDPSKTYQSVMSQMRKKKWGLNQRISYESEMPRVNESKIEHKQPMSGKQTKVYNFSPVKMDSKEQGEDGSKIVVNSRLKQFLFQ